MTRGLSLTLLVVLIGFHVWADETETISWDKKQPPTFDDFPVAEIYKGAPAPVVLPTSYDRMFRTQLRKQAKEGPNFAGHFKIAQWGCGSACVIQNVIDSISGHVYAAARDNVGDRGVVYRIDSRLYIANPPDPHVNPESAAATSPARWYVWDGTKMKLVYEETCNVMDGKVHCAP